MPPSFFGEDPPGPNRRVSASSPPAPDCSATLPPYWIGWQLKLLLVFGLAGCLALFTLARSLAAQPYIGLAQWHEAGQGRIALQLADEARFRAPLGQVLVAVSAPDKPPVMLDALMLQRSARWLPDDLERGRYLLLHQRASAVLERSEVRLHFSDGQVLPFHQEARGMSRLGLTFWLMGALALILQILGISTLLARPGWLSALFAFMTMIQAGQLLLIGLASIHELARPAGMVSLDLKARHVLDLLMSATALHICALIARPYRSARTVLAIGWCLTLLLIGGILLLPSLPGLWWWTQAACASSGLGMIALLGHQPHSARHPLPWVLRHVTLLALAGWLLLTAGTAASADNAAIRRAIADTGPTLWHLSLAALLGLAPFLMRAPRLLRRFSLLAVLTAAAGSLDLLFVAAFTAGNPGSLTLALLISIGLYVAGRQWLIERIAGMQMLTTERMFEQLYRIVREVELQPHRSPALLEQLLRKMFEPLETTRSPELVSHSQVLAAGSALLVPLPALHRADGGGSILLRFAQRGTRFFTIEDARLTDRVLEQIQRAVSYDHAVEHGRSEERLRIAQDLHDDIGARLLTLMYKAPSPEVEDYIRHTLQDLKTLTRGLATQEHRLHDAAAEWKSDIELRLEAAGCKLDWSCEAEQDILLNVVQWSALTRILRELTSNTIAHANASRMKISLRVARGQLELIAEDDGHGGPPDTWLAGLGLGGIRKRVRQLGGEVSWKARAPRGIECKVQIKPFLGKSD